MSEKTDETAPPVTHAFADEAALAGLQADAATAASELLPPPVAGTAGAQPVQSPEKSIAETTGVLVVLMTPAFAVLAPNWEITEEEVVKLAQTYAVVIEKYMPGGFGKYGPELAAAFVTVGIFSARVGKPRVLPKKKPDSEAVADAEAQ